MTELIMGTPHGSSRRENPQDESPRFADRCLVCMGLWARAAACRLLAILVDSNVLVDGLPLTRAIGRTVVS